VLTGILLWSIDRSILSSQCTLLFFGLTKSALGCTLVHLAVIMRRNSIWIIYIYIYYLPSTFSIIKITSVLPSLFFSFFWQKPPLLSSPCIPTKHKYMIIHHLMVFLWQLYPPVRKPCLVIRNHFYQEIRFCNWLYFQY